jgi:pyridoxal phosphate enzyme (YggS family)
MGSAGLKSEDVKANLTRIHARIAKACEKAGREVHTVHLLAVSKLQSINKIREAYEFGQRDFAENYVQEGLKKMEQFSSSKIQWHFIGSIQSNKIKYLTDFSYIHSVDSHKILKHLEKSEAKEPQKIFLQINIAQEESKGGVSETELPNLIEVLGDSQKVSLMGFMIMPPLHCKAEENRKHFSHVRELLAKWRGQMTVDYLRKHPMDQLSMGTSHDFEIAIEEGASWVRIGSDIFGERKE